MGKSTSCFKIIACGSDSPGKDDVHISESKRLNDKQGWSFRKRSNRQRVLSNTVITEIHSPGNKGGSDTTGINFQQPANCSIFEKDGAMQCPHEIPQLLATEIPKESEAVDVIQNENKVDAKLEESVVVIIQTAVRRLLAQRKLLKLKHVVKLQAAVRGHLVRKHAVGTLRCIQAIIKMQALVRARFAHVALEQLHPEELDAKRTRDSNSDKSLEKEKSRKSSVEYISMEKLLSNSFVQQLLESTSKTKHININYAHSKSENTWIWLERWTSFASVYVLEAKKAESMTEDQGREKDENLGLSLANTVIDSKVLCRPVDPTIASRGKHFHCESEDNLITYDMDGSEFQPCQVTSTMPETLEQSWLEDTSASNMKETLMEGNSLPDQRKQLVADSQMQCNPHSRKLGTEFEQHNNSSGIFSEDQLEVKEKKAIFGSRKATNPAFIAAQSKFQELSLMENSGRSLSSSYQDTGAESRIGEISSASSTVIRAEDLTATGDFIPPGSRTIQVGGSECGTELSVTSTLDSPDISEAGIFEYEHEANVTEVDVNDNSSNKNTEIEVRNVPTSLESNLSQHVLESPEEPVVVFGESISATIVDSAQTEVKPEVNVSDLQSEQDVETVKYTYKLSPSASPRSQVTILESQGTPSSQISTKSNKKKTDMSRSNQKRKPPSAGKKSPSNLPQNSDSSNNLEPVLKDQKNGKRRNSFGAKPDHIEEESRESSTNQSVPHFMRATESARAKVQLNNSPRSSPDVQETEIYVKKRHSLPGANGRQGSPRIQRSMSQAHQSGKGNERKWQR